MKLLSVSIVGVETEKNEDSRTMEHVITWGLCMTREVDVVNDECEIE